jgi:hypothetical protein
VADARARQGMGWWLAFFTVGKPDYIAPEVNRHLGGGSRARTVVRVDDWS